MKPQRLPIDFTTQRDCEHCRGSGSLWVYVGRPWANRDYSGGDQLVEQDCPKCEGLGWIAFEDDEEEQDDD